MRTGALDLSDKMWEGGGAESMLGGIWSRKYHFKLILMCVELTTFVFWVYTQKELFMPKY